MNHQTDINTKPIIYLWLVNDPTVKSSHWDTVRSVVISAENEEEVKMFMEDVMSINHSEITCIGTAAPGVNKGILITDSTGA
jgi:hypothetical protein